MVDHEKLAYDLSLIYAQEVLKMRPEEMDTIPEMNDLLLKAFKDAYNYNVDALGIYPPIM